MSGDYARWLANETAAALTHDTATAETWTLTETEWSALRAILRAHEGGMDWLGLTNVAIATRQSLEGAAALLAKPVKLGYVEQEGDRGAIYRLTDEGRRLALLPVCASCDRPVERCFDDDFQHVSVDDGLACTTWPVRPARAGAEAGR